MTVIVLGSLLLIFLTCGVYVVSQALANTRGRHTTAGGHRHTVRRDPYETTQFPAMPAGGPPLDTLTRVRDRLRDLEVPNG